MNEFRPNIIYHDFLPPPRRGSHVNSVNTHNHQYTPLCPHTWRLRLDFQQLRPFTVYPNCIMQLHPTLLQGISTRARKRGPKERRAKQSWQRETHSVIYICTSYYQGSTLFHDAQPPPSFLCCPTPSSQNPFRLTLVSLDPPLYLFPPSTPFWPYGNHPFFPHAQTISILSDPLCSLTPVIFQL